MQLLSTETENTLSYTINYIHTYIMMNNRTILTTYFYSVDSKCIFSMWRKETKFILKKLSVMIRSDKFKKILYYLCSIKSYPLCNSLDSDFTWAAFNAHLIMIIYHITYTYIFPINNRRIYLKYLSEIPNSL